MIRVIVLALVMLSSSSAVADTDPLRFWYYEGEESDDHEWPKVDSVSVESIARREIFNRECGREHSGRK